MKICDLVQKTLRELMPHATLTFMGINRIYSIKFDSASERDALGVRLVPPANWGMWGRQIREKIDAASDLKHGGMTSAAMREHPIPGRPGGWRDVTITPDFASSPAAPAAIISLNDHFQVDETEIPASLKADEIPQHRTTTLMHLLAEQFEQSINNLEVIAQDVLHG